MAVVSAKPVYKTYPQRWWVLCTVCFLALSNATVGERQNCILILKNTFGNFFGFREKIFFLLKRFSLEAKFFFKAMDFLCFVARRYSIFLLRATLRSGGRRRGKRLRGRVLVFANLSDCRRINRTVRYVHYGSIWYSCGGKIYNT